MQIQSQFTSVPRRDVISRHLANHPDPPELTYEHALDRTGHPEAAVTLYSAHQLTYGDRYSFGRQIAQFDGGTAGELLEQVDAQVAQDKARASSAVRSMIPAYALAAAGFANALLDVAPVPLPPPVRLGLSLALGAGGLVLGGSKFSEWDDASQQARWNERLFQDIQTAAQGD